MSIGFICKPEDLFDISSLLDRRDKIEGLGKIKRDNIRVNCYQNNMDGRFDFWMVIKYEREKLILPGGKEKVMTGDAIHCFFKDSITEENDFKEFVKKALSSEKNKETGFNFENTMRWWRPVKEGKIKIVEIRNDKK